MSQADSTTNAPLTDEHAPTPIAPGVHLIAGQGNSLLVETDKGLILTDSGPGGKVTRRMIAEVRALSPKPLLAIVYSHGHAGYNYGAYLWLEDAESRGHPAPELIAQERLPVRYRRYQETWGLQSHLNHIQFNVNWPEQPPEKWFTHPTQLFADRYEIDGGNRKVILLAAPSETDDALAVWLPDCRVLYAGPAFIKSIPNIGTPLRTLRDPVRWADSLERLIALEPEILIPEFGSPVHGVEESRAALALSVEALRYLRRETVARMNRGMTEIEILHDIEYPDRIFKHPLMKPSYGMPDYIVRDIWRSENGWWDRNPTNLHPAHPADAARAIREAIADPEAVLAAAEAKMAEGKTQLALHVLDLLALCPDDEEPVRRARALKAQALEQLAGSNSSFVSQQIYRAEARRLAEQAGAGPKKPA